MDSILTLVVGYIARGAALGLLAGLLAGAITWSVMKQPESLFRGVFGFLLGAIGFAVLRAGEFASLWAQVSAAAGGAMPRSLGMQIAGLGIQVVVAGLAVGALVLAISGPITTIKGGLFGALLGIFIGIILQVVITSSNLPLDSIYYAPLAGLVVMVVFTVFGAGSK